MSNEKNVIIKYQGNQISLITDERNDYINLTHLANAYERRKSILTWLRSSQTIRSLDAWEKKYNKQYDGAQMSAVLKAVQDRILTIKQWIDLTGAKGIFTRTGENAGTYAHKHIALKFASWLSPEFEMFISEEIDRLKELDEKRNSYELLTREQVLYLVQLKEVFKYVAHQEAVENAHKDVFASKSSSKYAFADFNTWRNEILEISPTIINERIQKFCIEHNIALTKKLLSKTKREKLLIIDSFETVRNAVWDFLNIKGEVNALNLANLVGDIIRTEQGQVMQENKTDLFHEKQDLGAYSNFSQDVNRMKEVKTARELLALKVASADKAPIELSDHNKKLQQALKYNPKEEH